MVNEADPQGGKKGISEKMKKGVSEREQLGGICSGQVGQEKYRHGGNNQCRRIERKKGKHNQG